MFQGSIIFFPEEEMHLTIELAKKCRRGKMQASIEQVYPEFDLKSKAVGYFDPCRVVDCNLRIQDLFPFFDKILVPLFPVNKTLLESLFGITIDQMTALIEGGKILPLLFNGPYLPEYLHRIYKMKFPSTRRVEVFNAFYKGQLNNVSDFSDTIDELGLFWKRQVSSLIPNQLITMRREITEYLLEFLICISITHDVYTAFDMMEYFSIYMDAVTKLDSYNFEMALQDAFQSIQYLGWGYGANANLDWEKKEPTYYLFNSPRDVAATELLIDRLSSDKCRRMISQMDSYKSAGDAVIDAELMFEIRDEFFYTPPEFCDDPVRYSYYLDNSPNISENRRIIFNMQKDIKRGRYKRFIHNLRSGYSDLIQEVNREIRLYDKKAAFHDFTIKFGAALVECISGAPAGQALSGTDLSTFLSSCGAGAEKAMSKELPSKSAGKLFHPRNTPYMLWRRSKKASNISRPN